MNLNKNNLMENFKQRCREENYKITPQRTVIYKELINSTDHPDVETLYNRVKELFPNISFDTVYRTLSFFYNIGVADIIDGICSTRRYEGNTKKHHHYLCVKCNKIIDLNEMPFNYQVPQEISQQFDIKNIRIIFEGVCSNCRTSH